MGCQKFVGAGSISQRELLEKTDQLSQYDKHRVYKTAKQACEYMGRSVAQEHGITFIWPLITNIFGVGEFSNRLINSMIQLLTHPFVPNTLTPSSALVLRSMRRSV